MALVCVAGQTYTLEFGLEDQSNAGLWKANPTIAAGDFQISVNGGAFSNVDNIPTVTPASGRRVALVISATETTAAGAGGLLFIFGHDASGSEWYDVAFSVRVVGAGSGDIAMTGADGDTLETLSDQIDDCATSTALATVDSNVDAILTDTGTTGVVIADSAISAAKIATDAITAAKIAADAITSSELAASAINEIADAVWDEATTGHTTAGTFGEQAKTDIDAILADTGTDGVVVANLTTAAKALVQAEAEDALETYDLDHFIQVSAGSEEPTDGSYLDQIMHKNSSQTFSAGTDSLEAIRDTMSSSTVTTVAAVSGSTVTVVPYTTWEFTIDGLADLSGAKANGVFFTVKEKHTDADSAAILQVQEGVGLLYINGAAGTAAKASLTVGAGEDEITVHVNASQTGIAEKRNLVYDVKMIITDSEDADQMTTGTFHIADEAVTRDLTV